MTNNRYEHFCGTHVQRFFGYNWLDVEFLNHGVWKCSTLETPNCFPKLFHPFYSPQVVDTVFHCSTSMQHLVFSNFIIFVMWWEYSDLIAAIFCIPWKVSILKWLFACLWKVYCLVMSFVSVHVWTCVLFCLCDLDGFFFVYSGCNKYFVICVANISCFLWPAFKVSLGGNLWWTNVLNSNVAEFLRHFFVVVLLEILVQEIFPWSEVTKIISYAFL